MVRQWNRIPREAMDVTLEYNSVWPEVSSALSPKYLAGQMNTQGRISTFREPGPSHR